MCYSRGPLWLYSSFFLILSLGYSGLVANARDSRERKDCVDRNVKPCSLDDSALHKKANDY